ncbi:16S rRNA (uracil(1498)-N(3))-methyltransferase [Paenibacillus abyssi]|uniref:Ribosomal RNA small subunit methyltransferase E n=1 Tax=Paenibacillus abyssi TaxID=1340531 RepID=A0A917FW81_9BACL|nr:16S rRNA (uracil(1498)-N(3))-methyltransferase [Paenibacillus abyssi]GGG10804.1 ribosomal RNA small subunit methyltransferase E [Paenibacillus abyssi]
MQRYFITPEQFGDDRIVINGDDAHHLIRVMRMKAGDQIIVSDGQAREALAKIVDILPGSVEAEIVELRAMAQEAAWRVTIAQSLPKGDKMETVIQKGTEVGAAAFIPFQSERMIVQYDGKKEAKRLERWAKIAKEAAEQAHRSMIPEIAPVHNWRQLLEQIPAYDLTLFCYEKQGGTAGSGIKDAIAKFAGQAGGNPCPKVLLIVGPEGGFTEREAEEARARGAVMAGLGKRILRTETAALVGLTCLMYESGEMGGA